MVYTVFKTPGLLDIKAITTFGLNAKPNSKSPIGYFGTGLKMAIAWLVRNHLSITLWVGEREYQFYTHGDSFRGMEFDFVRMKERTWTKPWSYTKLPFTTQLAKNWEGWMAFRELESNTRDEGGETFLVDREGDIEPDSAHTIIAIGGSAFADYFRGTNTIFLPNGLREPTVETPQFQIFTQPSDYLYYRGMRVMKLKKRSLFTYNVLSGVQLTEDRTLKDDWMVPYQLSEYLATHQDRALINRYLNATEKDWEYDLPWDTVSGVGEVFLSAIASRKKAAAKKLEGEAAALSRGSGQLWASSRVTSYERIKSRRAPMEDMLWYHFQQWLSRQRVDGENITEADMKMLSAVETDLRDSETEYP